MSYLTLGKDSRPVIAIVGAAGQLGTALQCAANAPEVEIRALSRSSLDVTDPAAVRTTPLLSDVAVIINAAAATDVDAAEANPGPAHLLNALAPKYLAERAVSEDAYLIHVSTDYVFGDRVAGAADARHPLRVDDPTVPQTIYGRTKLVGENNVRESGAHAAILRTAWLWSGPTQPGVKDFVSTMMRLAATVKDDSGAPGEVKVVGDQHGNPTFVGDLATAIWQLVAVVLAASCDRGVAQAVPTGTFHVTGSGQATWYELAREVFRLTGHDPHRVTQVTSAEFPRPAPRPAWSVLDGSSWREAGFDPLPEWQDTLRAVLT